MEHDLRLVFWTIHLVMLGLFVVDIAFSGSVWLKARVPGLSPDASRWRKLGTIHLSSSSSLPVRLDSAQVLGQGRHGPPAPCADQSRVNRTVGEELPPHWYEWPKWVGGAH